MRFSLPFDFNMLFDHCPYIVEIYDVDGLCVYNNQKENYPFYDSNYNILQDNRLDGSEFKEFLLKAFRGESVIVPSKDNYKDLFPWYQPNTFYEISLYPILNTEKKTSFIAINHREKIQTNQEVKFQEEQMRNLEKRIAYSFLSNISHELRTPLNWILGFSELISNEKRIEKIREFNKTISKGGTMLLSLVEKLIEMSCIAKNNIEMRLTTFEINQLLFEIYKLMQNEVTELGKDITIRISSELTEDNESITSDRIKLKQVLLNLVHNSIKFTKEGYIEIGAIMTQENEFLFYVRDTGIGIEKAKQKYIFELFKKAEEENFHEQYGLGLGLSISNNYVRNLGGLIWLESQTGIGTTFRFTIKDMKTEQKAQIQFEIHG